MKEKSDAIALAETMVKIGNMAGRKTYAVITDMNQPLGDLVGNNLEVIEAIETLKGNGPKDFVDDVKILGKFMLLAANKAETLEEAGAIIDELISSGKALDKFAQMVHAQHGDESYIYHPEQFDKAKLSQPVLAKEDGYVCEINTEEVGMTCLILGGGRTQKTDVIDPTVGIRILKKIGDSVKTGEPIAILYANDDAKLTQAMERLENAYIIRKETVQKNPTVYGYVDENGFHEM